MPTSPVTPPSSPTAIETVFGDAALPDEPVPPAPDILAEWRQVRAFLLRPTLTANENSSAPFTILARIYALDVLIMFGLIVIAGIVVAAGVELPRTALADMQVNASLIALVLIGAPLIEELVFRAWLPGKPGYLIAIVLLIAAVIVGGFVSTQGLSTSITGAFSLIALLAALLSLIALVRRQPPHWYTVTFPIFFWLSTLAFALIHLANFSQGSLAALLPLVIPQFALGMLLGYLRVRIGLWAAILLHSAHNATALGLSALAMSAGAG